MRRKLVDDQILEACPSGVYTHRCIADASTWVGRACASRDEATSTRICLVRSADSSLQGSSRERAGCYDAGRIPEAMRRGDFIGNGGMAL